MLQLKHLKRPSIVNNLILTALPSNVHVNFTPKIMVFQLLFCDRIIKLMAMSVLFHPLSPWFFVWFFTLLLLFFLPIPPQPTPRQGNQMAGDQGWPCDELECSSKNECVNYLFQGQRAAWSMCGCLSGFPSLLKPTFINLHWQYFGNSGLKNQFRHIQDQTQFCPLLNWFSS